MRSFHKTKSENRSGKEGYLVFTLEMEKSASKLPEVSKPIICSVSATPRTASTAIAAEDGWEDLQSESTTEEEQQIKGEENTVSKEERPLRDISKPSSASSSAPHTVILQDPGIGSTPTGPSSLQPPTSARLGQESLSNPILLKPAISQSSEMPLPSPPLEPAKSCFTAQANAQLSSCGTSRPLENTPLLQTSSRRVLPDSHVTTDTGSPGSRVITVDPARPRLPPPPPSPFRPKEASSYRDLFRDAYDDDYNYDKFVVLPPFNKIVYVSDHSFGKEDFYRYAWLLAQSEERWYTMPAVSVLAEMRRSGLKELSPMENPRPSNMKSPHIATGTVLTLCGIEEGVDECGWGECYFLHPDDMSGPEDKMDSWNCERCYRKRLELYESVGWVYLTVVRTDMLRPDAQQTGNGMGMFMLRRSASREQAAARAFHDAGTRGLSTVFGCAIRADQELVGWKGRLKTFCHHAHSVLIREEGVLRVLM